MSIMVTGGAGYIGSHTCIELLNQGYKIIILDNFSNSSSEAIKRIKEISGKEVKVYEVDLLDIKEVEKIFEENEIEGVIHFAGLKAVGESVEEPLTYYHNNITGTLHLCEVMQKHDIKRLVFSSSATVYGTTEQLPLTENSPIGAINPYGKTKQMIEEILSDLYKADKEWSIALLRYFNPVGAHPSGKIGEDPNGIPNNLMPYISQVAVGKLEKLNIFGNDYSTPDGTGVRDYIHVMDLATGHIKAWEKVQVGKGIDIYNLGTGNGYSVLEMVHAFEEASGRKVPYTVKARRTGDIAACYADTSKAKEQLGFEAKRGIEEMCKDTWKWQQSISN